MNSEDKNRDRFNEPRSGRAFAGLVLVIIGGALLGRQMGLEIPEWVLTWEMLVIGLGVFFGARRMFRPGGWLIMIIVGAIFLLDEYSNMGFHNLIWPAVIILFGLWMILKPKRSRRDSFLSESVSSDNYVDANSVFGGTKKKL